MVDPGSDEFSTLVLRTLDRAATPEEEALLRDLLTRSPGHRDAYVLLARQRGELAEVMKSEQARAVEDTRGGHTRRVDRRRFLSQNPSTWAPALIAAGILVGLVLFAVLTPSETEPAKGQSSRAELERKRAEEQRRRAEVRLQEIEKKRQELTQPQPKPAPDPVQEEGRKRNLEQLRSEKEQVERELREAIDRSKRAQEELARTAPPAKDPPLKAASPDDSSAPKPEATTQAAAGQIDEVQGDAFVVTPEGKTPLKAGTSIKSGQGIETGAKGRVVFLFADATRLELGPDTLVSELRIEKGKRVALDKGQVRAEVVKQPKDQAMAFATPEGEAKVLGTTLRLVVTPDPRRSTRLDVEEGKVELRNLLGKVVIVESGHYAISASGVELVTRPLPIEEILLFSRQGKISGAEWKRVKDDAAAEGSAFEALVSGVAVKAGITDADRAKLGQWFLEGRSRSWVTYTFVAEANKDYYVWMRGRCVGIGTAAERMTQDSVLLEAVNGTFVRRPADWFPYPDTQCFFDGFYATDGYWWSGGCHDPGKTQTPIVLRFARSGLQTIRMHRSEPPMRVDVIWLTTSQTARPKPEQLGPSRPSK